MKRAAARVACAAWAMTMLDAAQVRVVRHGDDRLSGITALDIVVNALNPEAPPCGVSQAALQEAAVVTLRHGRPRGERQRQGWQLVLHRLPDRAVVLGGRSVRNVPLC